MPLCLKVLVGLLLVVGTTARRNALTASRTGSQCCCESSQGESKCDDHYYKCLAFQQDPKCCKEMSVCEQFSLQAAPNLCTGDLELGGWEAPDEKTGAPDDEMELEFFEQINKHANSDPSMMDRDYTIIVDRSGSMRGEEETHVPDKIAEMLEIPAGQQRMSLWNESEAALVYLADAAVKEDPDGISLIFFDHEVEEFENVKTKEQVMDYFRNFKPRRGTTRTDLALAAAVTPDTLGRAETILVITDGKPDNKENVETEIVKAARQLCRDEDLAITFVQVGSSSEAASFLKQLDDELQQKYKIYDIVDTMRSETMKGMSFLDVVANGIED